MISVPSESWNGLKYYGIDNTLTLRICDGLILCVGMCKFGVDSGTISSCVIPFKITPNDT